VRVVAQLQRNKDELLQVAITTFHGHQYVDIRRLWKPAGQDEFVPTKKGVALRPEQLEEVIEALEQAQAELGGAKA
jgi:hypothetical protein